MSVRGVLQMKSLTLRFSQNGGSSEGVRCVVEKPGTSWRSLAGRGFLVRTLVPPLLAVH